MLIQGKVFKTASDNIKLNHCNYWQEVSTAMHMICNDNPNTTLGDVYTTLFTLVFVLMTLIAVSRNSAIHQKKCDALHYYSVNVCLTCESILLKFCFTLFEKGKNDIIS